MENNIIMAKKVFQKFDLKIFPEIFEKISIPKIWFRS